MARRSFVAAVAVLLSVPSFAQAGTAGADAQKFIGSLGETAISSLTGSSLSEAERGTRFRSLLESQFDMPGISKFVLARYWRGGGGDAGGGFPPGVGEPHVDGHSQENPGKYRGGVSACRTPAPDDDKS